MADDEIDYNIVFPDAGTSDRHWQGTKEPVVILLGWAGCKDKHLSKYSSIYNEQGCVTIRYTAPLKTVFISESFGYKELSSTALKLLEILYDYEDKPCDQVVRGADEKSLKSPSLPSNEQSVSWKPSRRQHGSPRAHNFGLPLLSRSWPWWQESKRGCPEVFLHRHVLCLGRCQMGFIIPPARLGSALRSSLSGMHPKYLHSQTMQTAQSK